MQLDLMILDFMNLKIEDLNVLIFIIIIIIIISCSHYIVVAIINQ